ncbi:MAG: hypothetical protein J6K48_00225 [Lachnospiraceae bacterium]|nr:hypothetical protein [Lachnospiraceae bacterium]
MDRAEFMRRLTDLLSDVPPMEREEAIQYYNDYFDDAGAENEAGVIASLGTPEELAGIIKAGLNDGGNAGEFTESGFKGYGETYKNEVMKTGQAESGQTAYGQNPYGQTAYGGNSYGQTAQGNAGNGARKKSMSGGMVALIVIAVILSSPLWIGLAGGLFGIVVGLLATLLGIFAAFLIVGVVLAVVGIALFVAGIAAMVSAPLGGLCMIGGGMICFAIGLVFIWLMVIVIAAAVPGLIRGIVNLCNRLFHRGGAQA